jgi:hypothetical protein
MTILHLCRLTYLAGAAITNQDELEGGNLLALRHFCYSGSVVHWFIVVFEAREVVRLLSRTAQNLAVVKCGL